MSEIEIAVVIIIILLIVLMVSGREKTVCRLRPVAPQIRRITPCQMAALRRAMMQKTTIEEAPDTGVWDNETQLRQGYKPEPGMGSATEGYWAASTSHGADMNESATKSHLTVDTTINSKPTANRFNTYINQD